MTRYVIRYVIGALVELDGVRGVVVPHPDRDATRAPWIVSDVEQRALERAGRVAVRWPSGVVEDCDAADLELVEVRS